MRKVLSIVFFLLLSTTAFAQKGTKPPRYFGSPLIADSTTSLMIPIRYNADLLTSNKMALWSDFYANILFYDFAKDSAKRLFEEDTFIRGFTSNYNYRYDNSTKKLENISEKWIFYFVTEKDYNNNGRIDNGDPSLLYVSDKYGNQLRLLTPQNENAVSIQIFDAKGFALIQMQRDQSNNRDFNHKDKDFYFIRLDLNTLTLGNKIELPSQTKP